jgi:hypothetical protein
MVCTHIVGMWKFLRIGFGADTVKAAFCIVCPECLDRMVIDNEVDTNEVDIDKVRRKTESKLSRDVINDIKRANDIVISPATYQMAKAYLAKTRPLIEVGEKVEVDVPGWDNLSLALMLAMAGVRLSLSTWEERPLTSYTLG